MPALYGIAWVVLETTRSHGHGHTWWTVTDRYGTMDGPHPHRLCACEVACRPKRGGRLAQDHKTVGRERDASASNRQIPSTNLFRSRFPTVGHGLDGIDLSDVGPRHDEWQTDRHRQAGRQQTNQQPCCAQPHVRPSRPIVREGEGLDQPFFCRVVSCRGTTTTTRHRVRSMADK